MPVSVKRRKPVRAIWRMYIKSIAFTGSDMMDKTALTELIERYKSNPESVYNDWFEGGG
jgi:hypothetical protein